MTEIWKPVPQWEDCYEVSNLGRVRSLERRTWQAGSRWGKGFWRSVKPRVLRPGFVRGYHRVVLQRDRQKVNTSVHVLVLEAFIGPRPRGMDACHFDDDRDNNALSNLRWDTKSANCADRTRNGGSPNALKTHCPQGHPYSPENTRIENGSRKCRKCLSRRAVEYKRRKRAEPKENAA